MRSNVQERSYVCAATVIKDVPSRLTQARVTLEAAKYSQSCEETGTPEAINNLRPISS